MEERKGTSTIRRCDPTDADGTEVDPDTLLVSPGDPRCRVADGTRFTPTTWAANPRKSARSQRPRSPWDITVFGTEAWRVGRRNDPESESRPLASAVLPAPLATRRCLTMNALNVLRHALGQGHRHYVGEFKADPFPFYSVAAKRTARLFDSTAQRDAAWLISRYDDVVAALKDPRLVKNRRNVPGSRKPGITWVPKMFEPLTRNMLDSIRPITPGCTHWCTRRLRQGLSRGCTHGSRALR